MRAIAAACLSGLVLLAGLLAEPAIAQTNPHDIAQESSFCIRVTGETELGGRLEVVGTGFLVEADGSILTSYHLLSAMEALKADPEKGIVIALSLRDCYFSPTLRAQIVDSKPSLDVLLLRIAGDLPKQMPKPLQLGSIRDIPNNASVEVLTGGFPVPDNPNDARSWKPDSYKIRSRSGPGGYTWELAGSVEGGRSGSAVYYETSPGVIKVVGIIKGETKNLKKGLFIPIGYADSLLLPLRLQELNSRLDKMTSNTADDAINAYLAGPKGSTVLDALMKKTFQAQLDFQVEKLSAENRKRVDLLIDGYMNNVIAYSSGAEFILTLDEGGRYSYVLPFYKTSSDEGFLKCKASYSNEQIRYDILLKVNDRDEIRYKRDFDDPTLPIEQYFVKNNRKLYYGYDDDEKSRRLKEPDASQKVRLWIDDSMKSDPKRPKGFVTVLCTILIVGPAKHASNP